MLRVGKYDQRISFLTFGDVPNGSGGFVPNPEGTLELSTFASIEQLKQSRSIEQVQMGLPSTFRVNVQKRKGFEPDVSMVVEWLGKRYQILTSPVVNNVRTGQEWIFDITATNG